MPLSLSAISSGLRCHVGTAPGAAHAARAAVYAAVENHAALNYNIGVSFSASPEGSAMFLLTFK
jgi:hypothetical protein